MAVVLLVGTLVLAIGIALKPNHRSGLEVAQPVLLAGVAVVYFH